MKPVRHFFLSVFLSSVLFGQTTVVVWKLTANQNVTSLTGNISAEAQSLSNMQINSYQIVAGSDSGASQVSTLVGGAWPGESAQNDTRYLQFTVRPNAGYRFNISSITLFYGGKGGGNMRGNIAYALDTSFTTSVRLNASALAVSSTAGTMQAFSYSPTVTVDTGKIFYLRVYPWYTSASTGKYLCLQNVTISGSTQSLTGTPPTVTTSAVSSIGGTTALCGGTVTDTGTAAVTMRGVCWSVNQNPLSTNAHTSDGTGAGTFSSSMTGLLPNTTYHVRAYAVNSVDVSYGADVQFTTLTVAPTVTTAEKTYVGVTTAIAGGTVTSSGGAAVTARGVCWAVTANPTLANSFTIDGTGTGMFVSTMNGLPAGVTFHYRAYATNSIGTSYGADSVLTTLAAPIFPVVLTTNAANITTHSASVIGNVTFDGGASVTSRGVCWNKTGNPTVDTNSTIDGTGMGMFGSYIQVLSSGTVYYARAYARNSVGIAYGNQITFTTLMPSSRIVVAKDGSGNFTTVADAFKAIPNTPAVKTTIFIKRGIYFEKDTLQNCSNVLIQGEDRDSTVIRYDDYSGRVVGGTTLSTSTCQTLWVRSTANDITFHNLTIQNISTAAQAVALNTQGDRVSLYNCKLLGFQDTYYTWGTGRSYHQYCTIQGSVDFIFGSGIAVFENCNINLNRNGGTLTAAATPVGNLFGYVFLNCAITHDSIGFDNNVITNFHLGRPWQNAPRNVFLGCSEPAALNAAGWLSWNVVPALYAEYNCVGPGSNPVGRVTWSNQLTAAQAAAYTLPNIFAKNAANPPYSMDWFPNRGLLPVKESSRVIPDELFLANYPNPFNPVTTIKYRTSAPASPSPSQGDGLRVRLMVYDILGREIATLVNEEQAAGEYTVQFNAAQLPSGTYFYELRANNQRIVKKMSLLK